MYEVLCERCWHTEPVDLDRLPGACPECGADSAWVGPFVRTPQRFSRRDGWLVLTSPLYVHAGQVERRARPR